MSQNAPDDPVVETLEPSVKKTLKQKKEQRRLDKAEEKAVFNANVQQNVEKRLEYLISKTQIYDHFITNSKKRDRRAEAAFKNVGKNTGSASQSEPKSVMKFMSTPDFINNGEMRDYQVEGLNWMISIYENGINGILADEMGLGKTLQTISFIGYLNFTKGLSQRLKYLVIVPMSTLQNWLNEFQRWCPSLVVVKLHGTKAERYEQVQKVIKPKKFDVLVTTYEMTYVETNVLQGIKYHTVILDEGHRIKNENTLGAKKVRTLHTNHKMILTGTPIHNTVHELWALMNFLMPDIFNSGEDFDRWFESMECINNQMVTDRLRAIIKPFMLRRIKADVEKNLKPKQELKIYVGMTDLQLEWYRKLLLKELYERDSQGILNKKSLHNLLIHLRKCTSHPYLFEGAEEGPPFVTGEHLIRNSGKMIIMDKLVARHLTEGSRILIFFQFTKMMDILEDYCTLRGYKFSRLDGSLTGMARTAELESFTRAGSDKQIFLLSTRAGGLGLNLSVADVVIIYDSDWNPQMDLQAIDRAHRIGQTKQVRVYKLIAEKSVDERIVEYSEMKMTLDEKLIHKQSLKNERNFPSNIVMKDMNMYLEGKAETLAEEDLDTILVRCQKRHDQEEATRQDQLVLRHKYESLYKFDGEDFNEKREQICKTLREQEPDMPRWKRRARCLSTYASGLERMPYYLKTYKPFWLFNKRLQNYIEKEKLYYMKTMQYEGDSNEMNKKIQFALPLMRSERDDYDKLLHDSFKDWDYSSFRRFIEVSARYGKDNIDLICKSIPGQSMMAVRKYWKVFWERYTEIPGYEMILEEINNRGLKRPHTEDPAEASDVPSKKAAIETITISSDSPLEGPLESPWDSQSIISLSSEN
ncbi:probable global transcription activator SNF2L1 [Phlebotomus argentipes]|uniref:probable global transcription activator SNF2L1 n=1 Tax=Phlebotomus argentipes TaxID=94469 RepID=UPI002892A13E|nr:probable global transcription activator SNF2L1 [Phlebotomus argentipes]